MTMTTSELGFIGLGTMGQAMSKHLSRSVDKLVAYDANEQALARRDPSIVGVASVGEVAERCPVIFLSLPGPAQSRSVIEELLTIAPAETIIVDTTTIDPLTAQELSDLTARQEARYLQSPVIGGQVGAEKATLTVICGGRTEVARRIERFLHAIGKDIHFVDAAPTAALLKLLNNLMSLSNTVVFMEALALAAKSGVTADVVYDVLKTGSGFSAAFERRWQTNIRQRSFDPGFSIDLAVKDLTLANEYANRIGMPLFASAVSTNMYRLLQQQGWGQKDVSALALWWEEQTGSSMAISDDD